MATACDALHNRGARLPVARYGSEFAFDTTGQEEVVIWNMYYGDTQAAKASAALPVVPRPPSAVVHPHIAVHGAHTPALCTSPHVPRAHVGRACGEAHNTKKAT